MLSCAGIGKRFGSTWIFRELSFEVEPHQALAIIGHNGSGKSTLLKVISSLLPPTEGEIFYPERPISQCLGYSALDGSVYPDLTVAEHLEFTGKLRGCVPRSRELLDKVGLSYASGYMGKILSTGMRTRLKLAIAIQSEPDLLLLDEPGAGLDENGHRLLDKIFTEQLQRGSVIFTTNDPTERGRGTHELDLY